jgi:probable HAF family extracellular repeat protein
MTATYTIAKNSAPTTTGADNDIIDGGDFKTNISAGGGINLVRTGKENDVITTGDDNDFIDAGDGKNVINAGSGNNRVLSGKGNDNIALGAGSSVVNSGAGNDTISAIFGNSIINAGTGKDKVDLGGSNNKIILEAGDGSVTITGFDIAKDKFRLGESLLGKSLTFTTKGADTLVMDGKDLLATIKGVTGATASLVDSTPLFSYKATELGSFNTTNKNANVVAGGINDFGQIAGRYDTAGTFINENAATAVLQPNNIIRQGFVWEKGKLTALTNVGVKKGESDFGAPNGTTLNLLVANVRGIGDRGVVFGTVDEVRQPIPVATDRAITWEQEGTAKYKLTIEDFGGLESYYFDTNNSKQYAGRNIRSDGFENPILIENGKVTDLADLGGDGGTAQGINNKGQIVGTIDSDGKLDEKFTNTAAIWEKDVKGNYQLKNLGTFGAAQASLRDINDNGDIIGAKSNGLSGTAATSNPFILRDGKLTDLGSLGGKTGSVNGINSFGTVVGTSQSTILGGADGKTLENRAFVWSEGKITDLNSLVTEPILYNGAKVVLTSAVGIDNFGDIAATGSFVYKDAVTGVNTVGTRAYELKGIANSIKPTANPVQAAIGTAPNPLLTTAATVDPLFATPQVPVANSIKLPETGTQTQLLGMGGLGNLTNPNTMTSGNVDPLGLTNTTVGAVDPFAQLQTSPVGTIGYF